MIPAGQEFILAQERGKQRLLQAVKELSEAFALAVPHDEALRIHDAVVFFQAVRAALIKHIPDNRKPPEVLDHAIRQIVSKPLVSDRDRQHRQAGEGDSDRVGAGGALVGRLGSRLTLCLLSPLARRRSRRAGRRWRG